MEAPTLARYTIDVDEDFDRLLTSLAQERSSTKADVIRRAVSSYSYLVKDTVRS